MIKKNLPEGLVSSPQFRNKGENPVDVKGSNELVLHVFINLAFFLVILSENTVRI